MELRQLGECTPGHCADPITPQDIISCLDTLPLLQQMYAIAAGSADPGPPLPPDSINKAVAFLAHSDNARVGLLHPVGYKYVFIRRATLIEVINRGGFSRGQDYPTLVQCLKQIGYGASDIESIEGAQEPPRASDLSSPQRCPANTLYAAHLLTGVTSWLLAGVILPVFLFERAGGGLFVLDIASFANVVFFIRAAALNAVGGLLVGLALAYALRSRPTPEHSAAVETKFGTLRSRAEAKVVDLALVIGATLALGWTLFLRRFASDPAMVVPRSGWLPVVGVVVLLGLVSTRISPLACKRLRKRGFTDVCA